MLKSDDRRSLCATFRQRLQTLIGEERGAVSDFLRDTGVDRSALAQFLDPDIDRLPRAESLRRIAENLVGDQIDAAVLALEDLAERVGVTVTATRQECPVAVAAHRAATEGC